MKNVFHIRYSYKYSIPFKLKRIWNCGINTCSIVFKFFGREYVKLFFILLLPFLLLVFFLLKLPELQINYSHWLITKDYSRQVIIPRSMNITGKTQLIKENGYLQGKLNSMVPTGNFIIINTTSNTFVLKNKNTVLHEGVCSTGSYILLEDSAQRRWLFHTPKGKFTILGKVTDPVWKKPDWAFIEEGLPVPPANSPLRYEAGVLGDYALSFGNGYLIHGTLYKRQLGMGVTHGCIRLGDDDLMLVYQKLNVGSKIIIF